MSTDHEDRAIAVDEESLAPWEPGGVEYVVRLRGELDDRWVESYVLTRRRSARFARFHLNRARGRVSFLCRESDNPEELSTVIGNLKLLVAQTNRRALTTGSEPESDEERESESASSDFGDETIATNVPRIHAAEAAERAAGRKPSPRPQPAQSSMTAPITLPESADPDSPDATGEGEAEVEVEATAEVAADAAAEVEAEPHPEPAPSEPGAPGARVLEAISTSLNRLEKPLDPRKARARLAQWMGTASLVIEDGGSEDDLVAALFAAGDFDGQTPEELLGEIGERFGERVVSLVRACDEAYGVLRPGGDPRMWSLFLRHTPPAARRIVCASRLRSARALLATYRRLDIARRLSFRDENRATLQDYRAVVEAFLEAGYSSHLVDVLDGVVLEMELAAGPASAERRQKRPLDRLTDELVQKVDLLED